MANHRRLLGVAAFLLLSLASALCPEFLQGQHRPGIERGDYWGEVRARYRSEVLAEVGELMDAWLAAWNTDALENLAGTYSEDATMVLDAEMETGRESIEALMARTLPLVGPIEYGLRDFDVSGDMAFATTNFRYAENPGQSGATEARGHLIWILVKHTGSWQIRSQIFQRSDG
jgi:uncharacterized protein (TIGR02246 family)